jgi:multidrug transporter EmrE-like cation transporter
MVPDRFIPNARPPVGRLLAVVLGTALFGAGFARYAQLTDGSGPVLGMLYVFGLWSLGAVSIAVAAVPAARGYSVSYSYAIQFGLLFGAVSVIGIAYTGQPPSQLERFGYGLLLGGVSALTLGTLAAVLGVLYRQTVAAFRRRGERPARAN